MIRHCVFIRFRPEFSAADRSAIYADLSALKAKLAGFIGMSSGPNVSPEGLAKGYDEGFIIDFADETARDAYLIDPDHKAIGARIGAAAIGGVEGIFVFDIKC